MAEAEEVHVRLGCYSGLSAFLSPGPEALLLLTKCVTGSGTRRRDDTAKINLACHLLLNGRV